jgi:non-heme chloroperoxidase
MPSISERENREIEAANAAGTTPVVFIHGLWLLPSSWANWVQFFQQAGYAPLTPDWPDDPDTVDEARHRVVGRSRFLADGVHRRGR